MPVTDASAACYRRIKNIDVVTVVTAELIFADASPRLRLSDNRPLRVTDYNLLLTRA